MSDTPPVDHPPRPSRAAPGAAPGAAPDAPAADHPEGEPAEGAPAGGRERDGVRFDTRVAVLLRDDLLPWQRLNVTAFTVSGIAGLPDVLGAPYEDASGRRYLPMLRQPVTIFQATGEQLRVAYERAAAAGPEQVAMSIYTAELFATPHDAANRAAVRAVASEALDLVGLAVRGRKKPVDKLTKGLTLHP
jgi:hypothetical protein